MITRKLPGHSRLEHRNKGFTLTEIAIVLGIMGLILGAIWVAAASVYNNQRVNQANTGIMQILQGVRTLYAQQATITDGDLTQTLIGAGIIPTNLLVGTTAMKAPWGGAMFVGGSSDNNGVAIELGSMTTAVCVGLISTIFGASHDRTLDTGSRVGGTPLTAWAAATHNGVSLTTPAAPIANGTSTRALPGASGTGCQQGVTTNSAILVFGLQG